MTFIPGQILKAADLQAALDQCLKTGQLSSFMANALIAVSSAQALLALGVVDATGQIPLSLLPSSVSGGLAYKGSWNASANSPAIPTAAAGNNGWFYIVGTAGTTNIGGISSWAVGDWIISNGSAWSKIANSAAVASVAGKTGAVTLAAADITDATTVGKALLLASTIVAQRAALGLGSAALLNSTDTLLNGTSSNITVGYTFTPKNLGNIGSFTVTPAQGNYQYGNNVGAFTITAPTVDCAVDILVSNGAGAGAITFSGFTVGANTGSALDTVNGHKFKLSIVRVGGVATYSVYALQ